MSKRIISVLLLILLAASFMAPASVSALATETTKVEVMTFDGTVAGSWEFDNPADALAQVNDVLSGKVADLSSETERDVRLTLGDDLKQDSVINVETRLTIDLNGHAIVRTRGGKKTKDGEVILIKSGAELKIIDSNPKGPGYDGISGGMIAGGASTNTGGGIHVKSGGRLYMTGGTIYNCSTKKHGGAIRIHDEMDGLVIERCTFTGNQCEEDNGGALYINDNIKGYRPIVIDGCVFENNSAGNKGGAIFVNDHGVVLLDTIITDNTSKNDGGGMFVSDSYDINVSGKVVISGNNSEKKNSDNLCLEKDDGQAYIFNGGLQPGSDIWVSASKGDNVKIAKEDSFTAYQTQYIHADNGTIIAEATKVVDAPLIGTIAGKGSLVIIGAVLIGLSILAAAGMIYAKHKNRKGETLEDETDD